MLKKLLVANRGEIAVRIIRAAQDLGIATVAVYSAADAGALHVELAHEAVNIGPPAAKKSYLNIEAILTAARETGCDSVHPGYGFLAENAAFSDAVTGAGLVFVGPSGDAIVPASADVAPCASRRAGTARNAIIASRADIAARQVFVLMRSSVTWISALR